VKWTWKCGRKEFEVFVEIVKAAVEALVALGC
jgi:hypothetical protein